MALPQLYDNPLRNIASQAADIVGKKQNLQIGAMKMAQVKNEQKSLTDLKAAWDASGGDLGKFMETEGHRFPPAQTRLIQEADAKKRALEQSRLGAQELTQAMVGPEVAETGMYGPEDIPQDQIYTAESAAASNLNRQQQLDQYGALAKTVGPAKYGEFVTDMMTPEGQQGGYKGRSSAGERIRDQILQYESQETHTPEETSRYKANLALQHRRLQGVPPKVSKLAAQLAKLEDEGKQGTKEYAVLMDKLEEEGMDIVTVKNKAGDEVQFMVPFGEGTSAIEWDENGDPVYNGTGFQLKDKRREELPAGALTSMIKKAEDNKALNRGLGRIGQLYQPEFMTFAKKWGTTIDAQLDRMVQSNDPVQMEKAKEYRGFIRTVAAEFNTYRTAVTGAQAGLDEIKWLEKAFLSGNMDRAQFESHLKELQYMGTVKQKLLDKQIKDKTYMSEEEEQKMLEPILGAIWDASGIKAAMDASGGDTGPAPKQTPPAKGGANNFRSLWE